MPTIVDLRTLPHKDIITVEKVIEQANQKDTVFFFDACTFSDACEAAVRYRKYAIDWIIGEGNFRITRIAFNELKAMRDPGWGKDQGLYKKIKITLALIERKWPSHILEGNIREAFEQLSRIEDLLTKTICFEVVFEKLKKIFDSMRATVDQKKYLKHLKQEETNEIMAEFLGRAKGRILDLHAVYNTVYSNIEKTLSAMANTLYELIILQHYEYIEVERDMVRLFENKVEHDKVIAAHFLCAKHPKKSMISADKDIWELITFHRLIF